jgi:hypothetical protein
VQPTSEGLGNDSQSPPYYVRTGIDADSAEVQAALACLNRQANAQPRDKKTTGGEE